MTLRFLLALLLALGGCGSIHSGLTIEPGTQFVLGGPRNGSFSAELANVGAVAVDVLEVTASGDTVEVEVLAPGASATARFARGSAALLRNRSDRDASVDAVIRGDTDLGMGYVPVD